MSNVGFEELKPGEDRVLFQQIEHFFLGYGKMEGKIIRLLRHSGSRRAKQLITQAHRDFLRTREAGG